jgi:hypothetical protein
MTLVRAQRQSDAFCVLLTRVTGSYAEERRWGVGERRQPRFGDPLCRPYFFSDSSKNDQSSRDIGEVSAGLILGMISGRRTLLPTRQV